jgi:Ca-activated chloride channel family protein
MMNVMVKSMIITVVTLLAAWPAIAQQERKFIREGNELFEKQDFEKAEVEYRKAADKKANSFEAAFNMADALYKQKKYDEALEQFSALAKQETDKERLGEIYHNIGNTLLAMEKTDESIEAYKNSLRNRPASEQTKYNLEFARHKQQQDQQNQDQNKDNQDQNKDQNQDQQDQNKDQQDQNKDRQDQNKDQQNKDQQDQNKDQQNKDRQDQNKDQQNKNDQNKDQQQQHPQQQQGKISKEDAERLLEALQNDEKNVQEKVQKQKAQEQKAKKMKIEKDW